MDLWSQTSCDWFCVIILPPCHALRYYRRWLVDNNIMKWYVHINKYTLVLIKWIAPKFQSGPSCCVLNLLLAGLNGTPPSFLPLCRSYHKPKYSKTDYWVTRNFPLPSLAWPIYSITLNEWWQWHSKWLSYSVNQSMIIICVRFIHTFLLRS